jgi:magnesium-transporting ATPase (P-type)
MPADLRLHGGPVLTSFTCSAAGARTTRSPRVSKDAAAVPESVPFSAHKEALDINNLLLRGSVLKKTDWAIGLAVNVGDDSKIVQNMTKAPRKVRQSAIRTPHKRAHGSELHQA